jgi:hypothetical protein
MVRRFVKGSTKGQEKKNFKRLLSCCKNNARQLFLLLNIQCFRGIQEDQNPPHPALSSRRGY